MIRITHSPPLVAEKGIESEQENNLPEITRSAAVLSKALNLLISLFGSEFAIEFVDKSLECLN